MTFPKVLLVQFCLKTTFLDMKIKFFDILLQDEILKKSLNFRAKMNQKILH